MKFIRPLTYILLFLSWIPLAAQNNEGEMDDRGRIPLTPIVSPQTESISGSATQNLLSKLQHAANENGLGATTANGRFLLVANVNIVTKDITSTAPPMVALNIDLDLVMVDYLTQQTFSSTSIPLKGVGQNETKAMIQALRALSDTNDKLQRCLTQGKTRIIEFYNTQCDFIIKEAQTLASMQQFEQAIAKLTSVPVVCKDCYFRAMNEAGTIFDQYQDFLCEKNFAAAKSVWIANPNSRGANAIIPYLANLLPNAACYEEAQTLVQEVRTKVRQDEQRDWDFMLKTWDDRVDLQRQRIDAYRQVGVAFGQNQPQVNYQLDFIRW